MTPVGLRIDVDTYRGTRLGVPALCASLARHDLRATFFFSVGPDNMGRHLLRLLRPAFLRKMLRTSAPSLYGWDILFRGTLGPGPIIGKKLPEVIRACAGAGHEIGLHAWDHHAWQCRVAKMSGAEVRTVLDHGMKLMTEILGRPPTCSAAPAWRCTDQVLLEKLAFPFAYNSDCRGNGIFRPIVAGRELPQPQIPTTLPTYDEVIGPRGVNRADFNGWLLRQIKPDQLNVLTVHAESEGIRCRDSFDQFLVQARNQGISFSPLGELLPSDPVRLPTASVTTGEIEGREGWISIQSTRPPQTS